MVMNELVRSVDLKLRRAGVQIQQLCQEVSDWTENNPTLVDIVLRDERHGFRVVQRDYVNAPPLDQWGLALGECIHNLRSALDNLVYALARLNQDPPKRPNQIAFPIFLDRKQFKENGRKNLSQIPPAAAERIEQLQPFQRELPGNQLKPEQDPLLLLQWLSNTDKHRVPSVVMFSLTEWSNVMGMQFLSDADADANTPPDVTYTPGPLGPGAVLMEWRTNCPIDYVTGAVEGRATACIEVSSESVQLLPTLTGLHQYILQVVNAFADFFPNHRTT